MHAPSSRAAGRVTALAAVLFLLPLPAAAGQTLGRPSLEEFFPASTWAWVRMEGLEGCRAATEQLRLTGLVKGLLKPREGDGPAGDPPAKRWIDDVLDQAAWETGNLFSRLGLDAREIREVLQGPSALGLGPFTILKETMLPSMLWVVDVGGKQEAALGLGHRLGRLAASRLGGTWEPLEGIPHGAVLAVPGDGPVLVRALVGRHLCLGMGVDYLREALAAARGEGPSLAQSSMVQEARGRGATGGLLEAHLDVGRFLAPFGPWMPYEVRRAGKAMGFESVGSFHLVLDLESDASRDLAFMAIRGSPEGLLAKLAGRPLTLQAARWCPPEAVAIMAGTLDGQAILASFRAVFEAIPEPHAREIHRDSLGLLLEEVSRAGIDRGTLRELIRLAGPEWLGAATAPGTRGLLPQALFFLQFRDPARAEELLLDILASVGVPLRTLNHRGITVHYVSRPRDPEEVRRLSPGIRTLVETPGISPAFAFHEGMLAASMELRALREALSRDPESGDTLAAQASFSRGHERVGSAGFLLQVRVKEALAQVYPMIRPIVEPLLLQVPELGLDPAALPSAEELGETMADLALGLTVDPEGITIRQTHPLGNAVFLAVAGSFWDRILARAATEQEGG